MISVLHITPHLGGGVGKAVSGLIAESLRLGLQTQHSIATLEVLEKDHHAYTLRNLNCPVFENIAKEEIFRLMKQADVVQIEFWNHPLIPDLLVSHEFPAARVLFWCHISGLFTPVIPASLVDCCNKFIFTSNCSRKSEEIQSLNAPNVSKIETISSGGGLETLYYEPKKMNKENLKFGYIGTLNFAKLHPDYINFLSGVTLDNFNVELYGDNNNECKLKNQLNKLKINNLLRFNGYTSDVQSTLRELDVLIYLLNPYHYGTAENALIESMAMGVVPIILANPAELEIVQDEVNGLVISTPDELNSSIKNLIDDNHYRIKLSISAAESSRARFSFKDSAIKFDEIYKQVVLEEKVVHDFFKVFGNKPSSWFLAFQKDKFLFTKKSKRQTKDRFTHPLLVESTKGSVAHFNKYFKDDGLLNEWLQYIENLELEDGI